MSILWLPSRYNAIFSYLYFCCSVSLFLAVRLSFRLFFLKIYRKFYKGFYKF